MVRITIFLINCLLLLLTISSPAFPQVRPLIDKKEMETYDPDKTNIDLDAIINDLDKDSPSANADIDKLSLFPYVIKKGDTPNVIAEKFGIDLSTILSVNEVKEEGHRIITGHPYIIPNQRGIIHRVKEGQSFQSIAKNYSSFGTTVEKILFVNDLDPKDPLRIGQKIFIPGAKLSPSEVQERLELAFILPIGGNFRMTSMPTPPGKNRRLVYNGHLIHSPHNGIDLAQPYGSPVRAPQKGRVVFAGWSGGYGKLVKIEVNDSKRGTMILYFGHLSKILVEEGQWVSKDLLIGKVGSTGRSTGPHLHLEIRQGEHVINPITVFKKLEQLYGKPKWYSRLPQG